jgi:hypothetical protein
MKDYDFSKIDWADLKVQKAELLQTIDNLEGTENGSAENLYGILHLIDSIQDYAVDELGIPEKDVFDLHEDDDEPQQPEPKPYFEIVHQGFQKDLDREEIQIHGGENANIFLIKTPEGFVVDVYGQNELEDTMAIFEDSLTEDPIEVVLGKSEVVQGFMSELMENWNKAIYTMPEDVKCTEGLNMNTELYDPRNFSDVEVQEFKQKWGQTHKDLCEELGYNKKTSDDVIMLDFFWYAPLKGQGIWIPKLNSLYTEREQAIANYLRLG